MSKKKPKRLNDLTALQCRVHNLEIALVVLGSSLMDVQPPGKALQTQAMLDRLFEANTAARGYQSPRMIVPEVADPV